MKKLLGMAAAAAAGYVAGVLFAPKSGEETRKDLKAKKEELRRDPKLREQVKNAWDQREFQTLAGKIVFRSLLRKYLSQ